MRGSCRPARSTSPFAAIASINSGQVIARPVSLSTRAAAAMALSFLVGPALPDGAFFAALPFAAGSVLRPLFDGVYFAVLVLAVIGRSSW